ncbi:titin-like isoform X2 [Ambystoma mexicanum]|uniref:titin-like isoform X2 n=1 Tax=Ambystoma mexicanum TaxID=8296 RepID=UPI0037E91DAD
MALVMGVTLLATCLAIGKADYDQIVQRDVTGTWKRSVVLPCSYPPADHTPHTVTWLYNGRRIFERDNTGDHTFVTKYRGRLSLPEDLQEGDVSLTILNLETDDRGLYTCKVTFGLKSTSGLTFKEDNIHLDVLKAAPVATPTIPIIKMASIKVGSTTGRLGNAGEHEAHQPIDPASTKADFNLTVQQDVTGRWKSSVVLPCSYSPADHTPHTVTWLYNGRRIFERDDTGDHTLITRYRGRLSLPEDLQAGDVSLTILNLETDDRGAYTCKVTLGLKSTSGRTSKEDNIHLDLVMDVPVPTMIPPKVWMSSTEQMITTEWPGGTEGNDAHQTKAPASTQADYDQIVQRDVTGTWKRSVVLPCSYPPADHTPHTVTWLYNGRRIFERDNTGDHTFVTKYRGRLSLPEDLQEGDVSLTILNLETDDRGLYTCKVTFGLKSTSGLTFKEDNIHLDVLKAAPVATPTIPIIKMASIKVGSTTGRLGNAREHETHQPIAPASTKADFNLTVQQDVTGRWKSSVVLPCSYSPADHTPHTVTWLYNGRRIFERDDTGDHTLITRYRGRLSLPEDLQAGDVSLNILNLETDDRGAYTCKVTLGLKSTSGRTSKEDNIHLDLVMDVPVPTMIPPKVWMSSTEQMITTEWPGGTEGNDAHQTKAPASTQGCSGKFLECCLYIQNFTKNTGYEPWKCMNLGESKHHSHFGHPSLADYDQIVQRDVTGTWKRSVVLPCSYPPADHTPHTVTWLYNGRRIFERDNTGDHTFVTKYRGRLSLPEDLQEGDVSLTILNLETDDRGLYTCKVTFGLKSTSGLTFKEDNIHLDVLKAAPVATPTIPIIKMASIKVGSTTGRLGNAREHETHQPIAPASTKADFNLTVQQDVTGRWKSSVVLPCSYSPADHTPHTVTWLYNGRRIFERDDTGDHTLITRYRGRLSLPEDLQAGDVSLTILNLETDDRGAYTCKVTLGLKSTSGRTSKEDNIHLDLVMDVPVPTMIPPKVWMSSTEQMITTEWPGGTEGNDAHQTKAPASTQDDPVRETPSSTQIPKKSTKIPNIMTDPTTSTGKKRRPQTTEQPGKKGRPQTTEQPGQQESQTPANDKSTTTTKDPHRSHGMPPFLVIVFVVLSIALLCILIAVIVCRTKNKKSDGIYEIPTMSALNAREGQDSSAVNVCHVTICQTNVVQNTCLQGNGCLAEDLTTHTNKNDYEQVTIKKQRPEIDIYLNKESEYEQLLPDREHV